MLQTLFRRAEATVDNAVTAILVRVLVAIPFLVAAAFATAAGHTFAVEQLGPALGSLAVAGAFVILGLVVAAFSYGGSGSSAASMQASSDAGAAHADGQEKQLLDPIDRDVARAVLAAVSPAILPIAFRVAAKNLPLVAVVAAAGYVMSRQPASKNFEETSGFQPAE
ncbi:MAG: hypothetical protein R3D44_04995 [Hyphomicrobiaceae bacterium]